MENDYQDIIKTSIQEIVEINKDANDNVLWQIIKGTIRNETIKYTSKKKKDNVKEEIVLKDVIDKLETELINNPHDNTY